MSLFQPANDPPTKLGIYRVLSSRAGVRVSPLALGAMSIGDKWDAFGMGSMNKESSFKLLDAYFDMGGNYIDTANNYQDETSEQFIGEWTEKRGIRDQLIIATKYTSHFKRGNDAIAQKVNYVGNSTKSMHLSVEASLKKLRTSYIDILYLHCLHNLVAARKVLYLGISDTPAWVVSQANQYAIDHGKTPFVIYQGKWNILDRSLEREIVPMAKSLGMAISPWCVIAEGKLRTDAEEQQRRETGEKGRMMFGDWQRTEVEVKVCKALEKVAAEVGVGSNIRAVAIAYLMHKTPYVFPILGGRKVEHLKANLAALDVSLSKEQMDYLDSVVPFDPGFPTTMIGDGSNYNIFLASTAKMAKLPALQPIKP
ncbi:NADP-dependent oxidoreductase domain-containing protein [Desarmillaria tabescens]|uniref:NADP-dependent oxidoreductase domain-containing protein n=1 Tax=Armillaria tabescens TaxID=1929756 RepID=A0AA39MVY0_ARMTA|nr:NADP-dependent oxidoreductase domain-containing protein [Desarmillaria tabescens]KAK0449026.1 NADP-dependent oxidoreductase domain-containing protein [Desarmillaria tabescens]